MLLLILISPLISIAFTFVRALMLFWPVMIVMGALHSHLSINTPAGMAGMHSTHNATFSIVTFIHTGQF